MKLSLPICFLLFFFPSVWSLSFNVTFEKDWFQILYMKVPDTILYYFNETYDAHFEGQFINESVKCSPDRYLNVRLDYVYQIEYAYLTDGSNNSYKLGVDYVVADPYHFNILSPNITFDFWIRNLTFRKIPIDIYPLDWVYHSGFILDLYPTASAANSIAHVSHYFSFTKTLTDSRKNFKSLYR